MLTRPITRGITRPITRPLVRQSSTFNPLTLFAQGQQGAWYDPSDLATLFQDSVGSDPVTADNDMTGMALDKHLGLELGPELVVNGTFDTGIEGWYEGTANTIFSWEDEAIKVEAASGGSPYYAAQALSFELNKTYLATFEIKDISVNSKFPRLVISGLVASESFTNPGNGMLIFNSAVDEAELFLSNALGGTFAAGDYTVWDNISVRELPGNHAVQDTTAAKPTYRTDGTLHWLEFDGDDDQLVATIPGITNATVAIAKSTGTEITYPVDLSSGEFVMDETNYGVIVREGEFTEQEAMDVTTYLNAKAGIS